jgi:hypothetical protein
VSGLRNRERARRALCREFSFRFHLAVTQVEHAEWLVTQNGSDEAQQLLNEARQTFEELEAKPWLERTTRGLRPSPEAEAAIA